MTVYRSINPHIYASVHVPELQALQLCSVVGDATQELRCADSVGRSASASATEDRLESGPVCSAANTNPTDLWDPVIKWYRFCFFSENPLLVSFQI